ncbi:hypothetical protein D3C80_1169160 [compost metagenome]
MACAGESLMFLGIVQGNLPDGFIFPNNTSAKAFPPSEPLNQLQTKADVLLLTSSISKGAPAIITTMVFGFAATTFLINSSCPNGNFKSLRSEASVS